MQKKLTKSWALAAAVAAAMVGQTANAAGLDLTWDWDGELYQGEVTVGVIVAM